MTAPVRVSRRNAQRGQALQRSRGGGFSVQRAGRGVARYYQLYEFLSGALNDGTIPAGGALPSEPELVARYKLSRTTVRRALGRLEEEGRIIRRRGSGTFARQSKEPARLYFDLHNFFDDVTDLAAKTALTTLKFEEGPVPAALRELQPKLGARAVVIQRLHRFHGTPYALTTAYVPEATGQKIRRSSLSKGSLITVVDQLGSRARTSEYTTGAVAADAIAAKRLDVPLGSPLLRTRSVLADAQGRLHSVIESLCRPDRFHVRAALERTPGGGHYGKWRLKSA